MTHLRRIDLERIATGELANAHLDDCADCSAAVAQLRGEVAAFAARRPAGVMLERVKAPRPRARPWWLLTLAPLAVAAGVALVAWPPRANVEPAVRLKGDGFVVLVTRGGVSSELTDAPRAGERVSFVHEATSAGHVLVLSVEGEAAARALVPFDGASSLAVEPGRTLLPDALVLDDTASREWVALVFCPTPFTLGDVVVTSEADGRRVVSKGGCRVTQRELTRAR